MERVKDEPERLRPIHLRHMEQELAATRGERAYDMALHLAIHHMPQLIAEIRALWREAAQARGDTAEEDRLLAHWARLDDQYRALWDALLVSRQRWQGGA